MAALRCRVGDLVMVKAARQCPENNGRFGTIVSTAPGYLDWTVAPQSAFVGYVGPFRVDDSEPCEFYDASLMPIRDPGADAVDEMVKRLGVAPPTLTEILQWSAA